MQSVSEASAGLRIEVDGLVQGVGFRPWVYALARAHAIRGRVWNHAAGVSIEAFGAAAALRAFVADLEHPPMPAARVRSLRCEAVHAAEPRSFEILPSRDGAARRPAIPADLATCDACRAELHDRADRRHGYPFINCTRCGPRYTISLDVPYDRARTTMAGFAMCDRCRVEYADPRDRRFHAQPIACSACGPRLELIDRSGAALPGDPIASAARLLRDGRIVAVKGLGGYHLACDATRTETVAELRARKQRDAKPFAVMAANLATAERLAWLSAAHRDLLTGPARPIVLAPRRADSGLSAAVAPDNPLVGLLLPYTPLHELLLAAAGRPLVMTSANRSDQPMICDDGEARIRLGGVIADALLRHDRAIANRCDDSVARVIAGRPVLLRRGRGWVPDSRRLRRPAPVPVLAVGAHLKNACCLVAGDLAWLGPHVGDLESEEAGAAFESAIERFARFVGVTPEVVVHDLHPDYFTTRWAHASGLRRIAVQHHHAHAASAMAEHGLDGPVLGLAWDGTGYGGDGTAWGGELLLADCAGFRRLATFRPLALAGGEWAIREVWRSALALLDDAYDGDPPLDLLPLFDGIAAQRVAAVRRMIAAGLNTVPAHGVGRYFDAIGAILLGAAEARFEGQVAMRLEAVADEDEHRAYPFELTPGLVVDLHATVRAAVADVIGRVAPATIAGRFHATLAAAAVELIEHAARATGRLPVVLTGGCFQNARLVGDLRAALAPRFRVITHEQVPPNDGGIALGQALVAAARLRGVATEVD